MIVSKQRDPVFAYRCRNARYSFITVAIILGIALTAISSAAQRPQVIAAIDSGPQMQTAAYRSQSGKSRGKAISFDAADSSIGYVLNEIARRAGLTVIFSNTGDELSRKTTVHFANEPAVNAIMRVIEPTALTATFDSNRNTVAIRGDKEKDAPQGVPDSVKRSIRGRVIDSVTEEPLSGVTITIASLEMTTTTSRDGRFALNGLPAGNYTVTAKLFGYRPRSQAASLESGQVRVVNFALASAATTLSGVVTSVTGSQRKLEIGNAITSIKVDSVLQVAPVSNLTELLEHRVPGLTVVRGSGQPGDPSRLRLRGASSINSSNDMIVVVDGVRVDAQPKNFNATSSGLESGFGSSGGYLGSSPFDLIDPNSIETIDVFKGPSAAAMYGSDAANGVLVITTKRGRPGPTAITAAVTRGISYLPGNYPEGTYAYGWSRNATYGNIRYGRCAPWDLTSPCTVDRVEKYQALNEPYYTILGRGTTEGYTMSASGGAPAAQYSFTGSATSEVGLIKMSRYLIERYETIRSDEMPGWMRRPDQYRTLTGTGQIASQIKPSLLFRATTGASSSRQRKTALGNSAVQIFSRLTKEETISDNQDRFYERMDRRTSATTQTVQVNWTPDDRIRVAGTAGINTTNIVDEARLPAGFEGTGMTEGYGAYSIGRQLRQQRTMNLTAEMPAFRERIRFILGTTYNGNDEEGSSIRSRKVPEGVTRPSYFEEGASVSSAKGSTVGWYIEPRLNLQSRFFMMPGFRLDNNGLSGKNAGAFLLPKLNLSWVMSDEDFLPWKDKISLLRLRLAGGVAGTQPGIVDRLRMIQEDGQNIPGLPYDALVFASLGNTRLQPERSTEFEGGIDLDLWNGRAGIVYTLYNKMRYDAIERVDLAPSVTLSNLQFSQNIGTVRNRGHEFEFRITPIERLAVAWTTNGSVATNTNKVLKLRSGLLPLTRDGTNWQGGSPRVVEGYPLWGVWAKPIAGYEDIDQNGILTLDEVIISDSMVYLGQPDPKGTLAWSNNVRLLSGRLSFNTMMSYDWGMMQLATYMRQTNSPFNTIRNKLNPSLEEQALVIAVSSTPYPIAQTVSTFRIQSISLNFVIPPHLAQTVLKGRSVSVALQGSNLWMHSNYFGKDPNVGSISMMSGITEDRGLIPQPRKWQLRFQWGS